MSPSSLRLLSLGSGGVGVGRIGGGTFSPPVGVGVGKPPLLFSQGFRRTGAGGGAPYDTRAPGPSVPVDDVLKLLALFLPERVEDPQVAAQDEVANAHVQVLPGVLG